MPSFGGLSIFGSGVRMTTTSLPRAQQANTFFGLSGVQLLDGGSRGRTTEVHGFLSGESPQSLAAGENQLRLMGDGVSRILVDMMGTIWFNVVLERYQPKGRICTTPSGGYLRAYQAQFFHLN